MIGPFSVQQAREFAYLVERHGPLSIKVRHGFLTAVCEETGREWLLLEEADRLRPYENGPAAPALWAA